MATDAQVDGARFQALYARVVSDPLWIQRVSEDITEAIHRELPELDDDEDLRAGTFASTRSVLTLMADMVRLGRPASEGVPPPDAVEYTREYVRRGVTIDALLRAYHVGHSRFFASWVSAVRAEVADPAWLARAVELGATWSFDYVQALNRELVERYAEERERWVRSAAAGRTETVRSLLAGERIDHRAAAQRLRYELERDHLAYVVWTEDDDAGADAFAHLEHVATQVAADAEAGRPLVVPVGRQMVGAWVGAHHPLSLAVANAPGAMFVAVGSPAAGRAASRATRTSR